MTDPQEPHRPRFWHTLRLLMLLGPLVATLLLLVVAAMVAHAHGRPMSSASATMAERPGQPALR